MKRRLFHNWRNWKRGETPWSGDLNMYFRSFGKELEDLQEMETFVKISNTL